jgi:hypothetical protein
MTSLPMNIIQNTSCRKTTKNIPDLKPYISGLSNYSSKFNFYIEIYVYGENFLPNGLTRLHFGNIQNIDVKYINSNTIYFELHNFIFPGVYNIVVKNTLHLNAKNVTANSVNGVTLESNAVQYTIIH